MAKYFLCTDIAKINKFKTQWAVVEYTWKDDLDFCYPSTVLRCGWCFTYRGARRKADKVRDKIMSTDHGKETWTLKD